MRNRTGQLLKLVCAVLGALVLLEIVLGIIRSNPLAKVTVPVVPSLSAETNSPVEAKSTNAPVAHNPANNVTNGPSVGVEVSASNQAPASLSDKSGTNSNPAARTANAETNGVPAPETSAEATNSNVQAESSSTETNPALTQSQLDDIARIMPPGFTPPKAKNAAAKSPPSDTGTNAGSMVASKTAPHHPPNPGMAMMGMMGMPGMGKPPPDLPIESKALVNRIVDSELLGPVIHPMPMGLLGIAGDYAFLRTESGQSGMVKLGDSLGDLKLVKIGINRVLVEQAGEKKELTIFDGHGSESLLPKPKENHDESAKK